MIGDGRPLAILIAEADQLVRMVTADMLTDLGYRAIEVGTAAEALAVLQGPDTVRMLITGRSIVGDGVALVHLVHHRWPGVGIIVTSGAGADLRSALPPGMPVRAARCSIGRRPPCSQRNAPFAAGMPA
ncbi:response regulator [Methylobacterium sp. WL30]|uniref:response regulator n=1 Tax=Methylobacterium sp. WL30 TaxID=2603895 RepID=UPI00165056CA|nr:response regulator [Methylobacterium sp. WL30]